MSRKLQQSSSPQGHTLTGSKPSAGTSGRKSQRAAIKWTFTFPSALDLLEENASQLASRSRRSSRPGRRRSWRESRLIVSPILGTAIWDLTMSKLLGIAYDRCKGGCLLRSRIRQAAARPKRIWRGNYMKLGAAGGDPSPTESDFNFLET